MTAYRLPIGERRTAGPLYRHPGVVDHELDAPLLHPLLAARSSPTSFDATYAVPESEIDALLDAARWAPSAGNSQPWAFIVGRRGDASLPGELPPGRRPRWRPARQRRAVSDIVWPVP